MNESWFLEDGNVRYRLEISLNLLDEYAGCNKVITAREEIEPLTEFIERLGKHEGDQYLPPIEEAQPEHEES